MRSLRLPYPGGEPRLVEGGGIGLPVTRYAPVTGDGQPAGERLQRGEAAGVLHEDVAGAHQQRHVPHPLVYVPEPVGAQLLGERRVAPADDDRFGGPAVPYLGGGLPHRPDPPGPGDQQGERGIVGEAELVAGGPAFGLT